MKVREPPSQLLDEILSLKRAPSIHAQLPQWLPISEHCLFFHTACVPVHVHTCTWKYVWEVEWRQAKGAHQEEYVDLQICYHWETSLDSPGKRKGLSLDPQDK